MKHIFLAGLVSIALAGCGGSGGGSGGEANAPTTPTSGVGTMSPVGLDVTVNHAIGAESTITGLSQSMLSGDPLHGWFLSYPTSLDTYTLSNTVNSMAVSTIGLSNPTFHNIPNGTRNVLVGGTTLTYTRFGLYSDKTNGSNTQYRVRYAPYGLGDMYGGNLSSLTLTPPFVTGTYSSSGAAKGAVGAFVMSADPVHKAITCNIIANVVVSSSAVMNLSFQDCAAADNPGFVLSSSGSVLLTTPLVIPQGSTGNTPTHGSTPLSFTFTYNAITYTFSPTPASGGFLALGPNGQEVMGYVELSGNVVSSSINLPMTMVLMFGAKR
jgi:hypothetical protein